MAYRNAPTNTDDIIDSRDIIARIEELQADVRPYTTGVNTPGYLPDNTPERYATADDARADLACTMRDDADDLDDERDDDAFAAAVRADGADTLRTAADALEALDTDEAEAEYGQTIAGRHYWISYDPSPVAGLDDEDAAELQALLDLADDADGYVDDWQHGATLVRESHFADYIREMLEECDVIPRGLPSYVEIDWQATADNCRVDYTEIDFAGVTYLVR